MEIYITYLLKILSFSSPFRRYEMKNFLYRPTMVADHISYLVAPPEFFSILRAWTFICRSAAANFSLFKSFKPKAYWLCIQTDFMWRICIDLYVEQVKFLEAKNGIR